MFYCMFYFTCDRSFSRCVDMARLTEVAAAVVLGRGRHSTAIVVVPTWSLSSSAYSHLAARSLPGNDSRPQSRRVTPNRSRSANRRWPVRYEQLNFVKRLSATKISSKRECKVVQKADTTDFRFCSPYGRSAEVIDFRAYSWESLTHYCPQLTPSVCLSVTPLQIASSFLFLGGIEPFLAVSSPCGTLQNFFLDFRFRPLTPKIYSSKFAQNRL